MLRLLGVKHRDNICEVDPPLYEAESHDDFYYGKP